VKGLKTDDGRERVVVIDTSALVIAPGNQSGLVLLENAIRGEVENPTQAQSTHTGHAQDGLVCAVQLEIIHLPVHDFLPTVDVVSHLRLAYVTGVGNCESCIPPGEPTENATRGYSASSRISIASPPPPSPSRTRPERVDLALATLSRSISKLNSPQWASVACERSESISTMLSNPVGWLERRVLERKGGGTNR